MDPIDTRQDSGAAPLAAYALFQTRELDEARERVASVFCPHRLDRIGKGRFDARHHHLAGERLSLNYIDYGTKTLISPGHLRDFYLFQMPLSGAAAISNGGEQYCSDPERAAMLNPHRPTTMIWDDDCRQVLLRIDRAALSAHLGQMLGMRADRPLTFAGPCDLTARGGAALRALILHLVAEADAGRCVLGPGSLLGRQIESALMTGLLEAHCHNYADALDGRRGADLAPRVVRRAEDYMMAHIDRPLALDDVAAAVGVSARALQYAFRRFRDTTPMAFLRNARLERAHHDLQAARPGDTVTEIATRWGFSHFGRFADTYRARFGRSPRQTLQDARLDTFVS
ncbi:MAG: Transcriptional regulator containing an amidase domain and an AraC-type DNA-binding HTH domain [Rhodobacteraceae bacterium HLUCCA12]|nr:MAG: Transcriptional regulator containing an amidase domain and an AraC-type DNA-binding HTH domain [Rhodobacteraceae bacterium HLUCCA12]